MAIRRISDWNPAQTNDSDMGQTTGEIVLGRGEYDIVIATGRPPSQAAVTTAGAGALWRAMGKLAPVWPCSGRHGFSTAVLPSW